MNDTIKRPAIPFIEGKQGILEQALERNSTRKKELTNKLLYGSVKLDEIDVIEDKLRELREQERRLKHLRGELKRLLEH